MWYWIGFTFTLLILVVTIAYRKDKIPTPDGCLEWVITIVMYLLGALAVSFAWPLFWLFWLAVFLVGLWMYASNKRNLKRMRKGIEKAIHGEK